MKSPMIQSAEYIEESDKGRYSELQVLRSGAGYYIGTIYTGPDGFQEPGSRDSDYFGSEEEAQAYLNRLEGIGEKNAALFLRSRP